jgi:hypothetical protein
VYFLMINHYVDFMYIQDPFGHLDTPLLAVDTGAVCRVIHDFYPV